MEIIQFGKDVQSDPTIAFALGGVAFALIWAILLVATRIWKVSSLPVLVLYPTYSIVGVILHHPASTVYLSSDGEYYLAWAYGIAEYWREGAIPGDFPQPWPGRGFWPVIIASLIYSVGENIVVAAIVLNSGIVALACVVLQKATEELSGDRPRWSITWLFLSSPAFLIFGPSLLREAIFWLGTSFGTLAISLVSKRLLAQSSLYCLLAVFLLLAVRPDAGLVTAWSFIAALLILWGFRQKSLRSVRLQGSLAGLVLLAALFPFALDFVRPAVNAEALVQMGEGLRGSDSEIGNAEALTRMSEGLSCNDSVFGLVCRAIVSLPATLFGPFPWEYRLGPVWFMAGIATLHFLLVLALAGYFSVVVKESASRSIAIIGVALILIIMFASVLTNYGILVRFRAASEVLLIPLAVGGLLRLKARWTR